VAVLVLNEEKKVHNLLNGTLFQNCNSTFLQNPIMFLDDYDLEEVMWKRLYINLCKIYMQVERKRFYAQNLSFIDPF
jgi:hypothetical protein